MKNATVSPWTNGTPNFQTGSGLGLRISKKYRDVLFLGKLQIWLILDGRMVMVNLNKGSFWRNCPELINKEIGAWLIKHNYINWKKGRPPMLQLIPFLNSIFLLKPILN